MFNALLPASSEAGVRGKTSFTIPIFSPARFLSMHIDAYCNTEATTSLIRQHIPAASLIQENDEQLVYTLPLKDMDKFAGRDGFVALQSGMAAGEKAVERGCSLRFLLNCHFCT